MVAEQGKKDEEDEEESNVISCHVMSLFSSKVLFPLFFPFFFSFFFLFFFLLWC